MDISNTGLIYIPPWRNSYRYDAASSKELKDLMSQYRKQTKKDKPNGERNEDRMV